MQEICQKRGSSHERDGTAGPEAGTVAPSSRRPYALFLLDLRERLVDELGADDGFANRETFFEEFLATARFGRGDVQWLTTGAGIVHSEMFPLRKPDASNRLELFQIWVNLPAKSKVAKPYFTMFWDLDMPRVRPAAGVEVTLVAGALDGAQPPAPPPDSWAAGPDAELAIWLITLEPGAKWMVPPAKGARTARTLYLFSGAKLEIEGRALSKSVVADRPVTLTATDGKVEVLLMQGRPIGEPVAQYGPFVMNTRAELEQAFYDYRRTQFGGWPFKANDPVHPRERGRFAKHAA